jgi:hypothetical protein
MKIQTYRFYDSKNRRLAIFYDNGLITVIPCSKKDHFSIKKARELYDSDVLCKSAQQYKAENIKDIDDFIAWCRARYKKLQTISFVIPGQTIKVSGYISSKPNRTTLEVKTLN